MAQLSLWLLGSFRVTLDGEPVTDFATHNARALLAYLSVESDRPHRRDALAGLLWPHDSRKNALRSLRQALYQLRQAIGDRDGTELTGVEQEPSGLFLLVSRHTIQFNAQSDHWLDVATFSGLAEECRRHRHRRRGACLPCLRRMRDMVALYQGEFLEHFSGGDSRLFEEWVMLEREWLHREAMEALICLADYHERRGDVDRARRYARRQVEMEPWREEAHRQLMRLLALDGQRSAALAQYKACRQALAQELRVEPTDETTALYDSIRARKTAPLHLCSSAPMHSLPPSPTAFVGRKEELTELAELLANPDCRLVSLVGPGGIGKSRLALQAARDQVGNFAHGVGFVPLTSITSPELLVSAIADVLGFSFREKEDPEQQLLNYLRGKDFLLVLDGMERILEGAGVLAKILHCAPEVIILATSQERLNLREEWIRALGGLPYPEQDRADGQLVDDVTGNALAEREDLAQDYSAIELFCQRARRVRHRFSLSAGEAPHVVRICQLVEGLPLGIELAAAWSNVRSCQEIASQIERNLDILATPLRNIPDRQRSIRATFEHSWQLLSQDEKNLLARLSVFRGGFSRKSALQVTGTSLSALLALANKSLVHRVSPDRYDMHSLLTQFAAEKLSDRPGQRENTEMQHARYFAAYLDRHRDCLTETRGDEDAFALATDIENVRQAWHLAVEHDCAPLVECSSESLYLFYDRRCRFQQGIDLFSQAIERWKDDEQRRLLLATLLSRQGALYLQLSRYGKARAALERSQMLLETQSVAAEQIFCLVNLAGVARRQGDYEETRRLARKSLTLSRELGDSWGITHSLLLLGLAEYRQGDVERAEALLEESLALAEQSNNPRLVVGPLNVLGDVACHRGDYVAGQSMLERCLSLTRKLQDQFKVAVALNNLGTVFHVRGNVEKAEAAYRESLDICREVGDREGQAIALSNLGEVAYATGTYGDAERICREGLAIGREIDDPWTVTACLNSLGQVAQALHDNDVAKECFAEALTIAYETHTLPLGLKVLVNLADLFAQEGRTDYATDLLGLANQHDASEETTRNKARRLLDEMGLRPTGIDRSLEKVIVEVLGQVADGYPVSPSDDRSRFTP